MKLSRAFTVIELIFVIVVLGILSAVALPKFASTGDQARVASGKADVMAIRSAILAERQKRIILGMNTFIPNGNGTYVGADGNNYSQMDSGNLLFSGVLTYSKQNVNQAGQWRAGAGGIGSGTYFYNVDGVTSVAFTYYPIQTVVGATTYNAGTFTCNPATGNADADAYCTQMIY